MDGPAELAALFEAHGEGLPSAVVETGGGGWHFYFRLPAGVKAPKNSVGVLGAGIDTKGEGGQVVAPPSVHESGKRYRWLTDDGEPPRRDGLPVAPGWLLKLLRSPASTGAGDELSDAAPTRAVSDAGAELLAGEYLRRVRGAVDGTRNAVLNRAAFCFGQLDGAGRIDAESVRADLWEACAGYRADDGDEAARLTIASGWAAGRGSPLPRERAPGASSGSNGAAAGALGGYCLDGPGGLGLEPLGDARRLLDSHGGRLLVAWGPGRDGAREAAVYALDPSGLWVRAAARLGAWHCERSAWWENEVTRAARGRDWPRQLVKAAKGYLRKARGPKGIGDCLAALPVLVAHLAEHGGAPGGLTQCETGELDGTRWLGAPNGVIDLHTGRLLPAGEGRRSLVTASLPDPFDPGATHPDVEQLTAHLPLELAEWLWCQLAYCLHGVPARAFVVLTGPAGGRQIHACPRSPTGRSPRSGAAGERTRRPPTWRP